jgi:hypothetical protein
MACYFLVIASKKVKSYLVAVADPGIFQRGGSTLKVGFQKGGGVPLLFWVFKGGFHSQNALFLPYFEKIF